MARLVREQLKLFGLSGAASYFGKFGSKAAASPVTTKDLDTIQSLAAWNNGLQDAVVTAADGSKAPFLEDINSMQYVHSYQQAYMFQEGIPEWEITRTYYKGSIVKRRHVTGSSVYLYTSLIDSNLGNSVPVLGSDSNWQQLVGLEDGNLIMEADKKFYMDGGYNTYIWQSSGDRVSTVCNAITGLTVTSLFSAIPATNKFFFDGVDGTGTVYIKTVAANDLRIYAGGNDILQIKSNAVLLSSVADLKLVDAKSIYWGDNKIENSGGSWAFYSNSTGRRIYINPDAANIRPDTSANCDLGQSSTNRYFNNAYAINFVSSSRKSQKTDIRYFIPKNLFDLPRMARYRYKDNSNRDEHIGYILDDTDESNFRKKGYVIYRKGLKSKDERDKSIASMNAITAQLCETVINLNNRLKELELNKKNGGIKDARKNRSKD